MKRLARRVAPAAVALSLFAIPGPDLDRFVAVASEPPTGGVVFLNDAVGIDFTNPVDLSTANLNTVRFTVLDLSGTPLAEIPTGTFRLGRTPGSPVVGRRLWFEPDFPTNNGYSNGGFRAGRTYVVNLPVPVGRAGPVLRDVTGRGLAQPFTFQFSTPTGTTPAALFRNPKPGGPARAGFRVTSLTGDTNDGAALLNKGGQTPVVVSLEFDQALNPHSDNVPVALNICPAERSIVNRGRIFLEYDDTDPTVGPNAWIPAKVLLVRNDPRGAIVELHPAGVLPNNATIRVIVENTVEDISGESNVASASYDRVFATFGTLPALQPQFDAIVEGFDTTDWIDFDAPFLEPLAEVNAGFVRANFDFEGSATILDYRPTQPEVILNTEFTQITPVGAPPINVAGGVFEFRNVTIPAGVTVRGVGANPMVWLVTGDFTVDGTLCVDGGDGESVFTLASANFPAAGGIGAAGGGTGGRGSPNTAGQSPQGEGGFGPGQVPSGGGWGGRLNATSNRGSGGGGGSMAFEGDPYFKVKSILNSFTQQRGNGGWGGTGPSGSASRNIPGGQRGARPFLDARGDNDFWGSAVSVQRQERITGELAAPEGGAGGGGGGDNAAQGGAIWLNDAKGAGGGGGGGVLIIKVLGTLTVGPTGQITANGGHGGGGEQAGGNTHGGGGGGGSGGMVVVMVAEKIRIVAHGETYANNDYNFAISADGGVGVQSAFGGIAWSSKYPPPAMGSQWDNNPAGGFGGLGVVQLMAPAGVDSDGTGTVLDDNIDIIRSGQVLQGTEKVRYIAWRGFPNESLVWVDDNNNPTYNNYPVSIPGYPTWANSPDDEGDIRPAPVLLPSPFGHKSRLRSKWLDAGTGAVRLPVQQFGPGPRRIIEDPANNLLAGPRYEFAGTNSDTTGPRQNWTGYVDYNPAPGGGIALVFPEVPLGAAPPAIATLDPNATFQGQPAYEVTLAQAALGTIADRYAQYQAKLIDTTGTEVGSFRILSHSRRRLWLSTDQGLLPTSPNLRLRIVGQFFDVRTNGVAGLGPTYTTRIGRQAPFANVQIGFAFHKDPRQQLTSGQDPNRLPNAVGTFVHDLGNPVRQEQTRTFQGGAPFVLWDMLFNTRFSEDEPFNTRAATPFGPQNARTEIHWLVMPFRY